MDTRLDSQEICTCHLAHVTQNHFLECLGLGFWVFFFSYEGKNAKAYILIKGGVLSQRRNII